MQNTTHYNLTKAEGTDTVNLLTQCYPNFDTIDAAMFANKQGSIGTATEVTTGTVHAITRNNSDSDVFRFTATSAWSAGDTMTLDGVGVTVHLADGTTPATGAYIIGAEVLGVVNGSLVTLFLSSAIQSYVSSFNTRTGAVSPASSDYDASMIDYDNTISGLNATDVQGAVDEIETQIQNIQPQSDIITFEYPINLNVNTAWGSLYNSPTVTIDISSLGLTQTPTVCGDVNASGSATGFLLISSITNTSIQVSVVRATSATVSGKIALFIKSND